MKRRRRRISAPVLGGLLAIVLIIGGLAWLIRGLMASAKQQSPQRMVQNITLIRPPPPPDTPPPPPPPEKIEQQIQQKLPEPTPDNSPAPPPQQLGLDTSGTAGADAFGLVARQGGSDLTGSGGAVFAWYTGKIRDAVNDCLTADPRLHAKKFTVDVRVWISADGSFKQVRLSSSSGSRDIDGEITAALASVRRLDEGPPLEMPQPVTLQIVGRT